MTGRVLVVEDDDDLRRLLSIGLRAAGHDVEPHASADQGLSALAGRSADVVVTDLRCPARRDGVRIVDAARAAGVPVVVVSGADEEADGLGADVFLRKPVDVVLLGEAVTRLLRRAAEETAEVSAFVAQQADGVLDRAVQSLERCDRETLPDVAHRLIGTLGSFGLTRAADAVRALLGCAPDEADAELQRVIALLREEAGA